MSNRKLKVNMEMLEMAFDDGSGDVNYFLDIDTGQVVPISGFDSETEESESEEWTVRHIEIPKGDSHVGYEDMQDFIRTVSDLHLREKLEIAIDGPGAFSRFKTVLGRYSEERKRWLEFKERRLGKRIKDWLRGEHIDVEA